jgi:serine/threonine protein kinase
MLPRGRGGFRQDDMSDNITGSVIAERYRVTGFLRSGRMGDIYVARRVEDDRKVAVKVLDPGLFDNDEAVKRFEREAKVTRTIDHPCSTRVLDYGRAEQGPYLVMEYVEGELLSDVIDEHGALAPERAARIAAQIALALQAAHAKGVIHRDLAPSNVLIAQQEGRKDLVKVTDFGLALLTHEDDEAESTNLTAVGVRIGTPTYMAPEYIEEYELDARADIYGLGVMLFEMLTGKLPFSASDAATFFVKHLKEPPPSLRGVDPSLPVALDRLCLELMAKSPAERPVDAHRVYGDLMAVAEPLGIHLPKEPQAPAPSSRQPSIANEVSPSGRWDRRARVFTQMLARAYPKDRPSELAQLLSGVQSKVAELTKLEGETGKLHDTLNEIEARGRDGRQRFGHAVHALGVDASRARDEAKSADAWVTGATAEVERMREALLVQHKQVTFWEGRSGFVEPYAALAAAYRSAANSVDEWVQAKQRKQQLSQVAEQKRNEVSDLEFQIQELRNALAKHEETIERQQTDCQKRTRELGERADRLETELLELATKFCSPLRARPELGPLFTQLEKTDAAA